MRVFAYQSINITTTNRKTTQNEWQVKSKAELVGDSVARRHLQGAPVAVRPSVRDCNRRQHSVIEIFCSLNNQTKLHTNYACTCLTGMLYVLSYQQVVMKCTSAFVLSRSVLLIPESVCSFGAEIHTDNALNVLLDLCYWIR